MKQQSGAADDLDRHSACSWGLILLACSVGLQCYQLLCRCTCRSSHAISCLSAGVAVGLTAVSTNVSSFQLVLNQVTRLVESEVDTAAARKHLRVSAAGWQASLPQAHCALACTQYAPGCLRIVLLTCLPDLADDSCTACCRRTALPTSRCCQTLGKCTAAWWGPTC